MSGLGAKIMKFLADYLWSKVVDAIRDGYTALVERRKQDQIDRENLERYNQSVQGGTNEQVAQSIEDLINGSKRP